MHAEGQGGQRRAAGSARDLFAREIGGAERGACIAGNGLDVDMVKRATRFQRAHEKNIQEDAAGQAQRSRPGLILKIRGELKNQLFEIVLRAARQIGTHHGIGRMPPGGKTEFTIKLRRENAAVVRPRRKIAAVQRRQAVGFPGKQFAKRGKVFGLAIFAQPLDLVLILVGTQAGEFGDTRIKPAERIRKFERLQRADLVAFAQKDHARLRIGALIEGKDERAIKAGSVVGAGGMTEMMIEMSGARAAPQEILQLQLRCGSYGPLAPAARMRGRCETFGKCNGAAVRQPQVVFVQAPLQSEARNCRGFFTTQFLFFNGEENGVIIDQRHRRAWPQCGDAEYVHEGAQTALVEQAKTDSSGKASRFLPSAAATETVSH